MFQLSPVSLKPVVRASRDQHAQFETRLVALIRKVAEEKEVVDIDFTNSKRLLNSFDSFMSYGLLSANKCYWPFVREFLPKTETCLLRVEWQCNSDRALSLAWLKDALNRGSLHFQLLSFKQSKPMICRFYHQNACLRNYGMLDRITAECERLTLVQFSFNSPSVAAQDFVPTAVVIEPSPLPPTRSRRRVVRRDTDNESEAVAPVSTHIRALPTERDQEYLLNELLNRRRVKMNGGAQIKIENEGNIEEIRSSTNREKEEQRIDEAIMKSLSIARIDSLVEIEPRSFDSIINVDDLRNKTIQAQKMEEMRCEGEIILQSGDELKLAMDIFRDNREKIQHCYRIYESFVVGRPSERLLVITDHNIYVLSQSLANEGQPNSQFEVGGSSSIEYHEHCVAPIEDIDYVGLSDDAQCVLLFAKQDKNFEMMDGDQVSGRVVSLAAGDKRLGTAIAESITKAAEVGSREHNGPPPPPTYTDNTPYALIVRRFLCKELAATQVSIQHTALAFWRETSTNSVAAEVSHQGYVMHRSLETGWWRKPSNDWSQSYFLLQGRKLYVFTDSSCKVGERVIILGGGSVETQEVELKKDHTFVLQVTFPTRPDEVPFQLQWTSREEMAKWMHLISIALSSQSEGEDAAACAVVVTDTQLVICQEGEKLLRDEFMRALLVLKLDEITDGIRVQVEQHTCLLLQMGTIHEWFFFRTEAELSRICTTLGKYIPIKNLSDARDENFRVAVSNQARRVPDLWHRADAGAEQVGNCEE